MRLLLVPRWAGRPHDDWYPWLVQESRASGAFDDVAVWELPDPDRPEVDACVAAFRAALGDDADRLADTVVVAHSVGAQVVLRSLAARATAAPAAPLRGVLAVAGWFRVDDVRATSAPWVEPIPDLDAAVAACGRLVNLVSDDEPMIADWLANAWAWAEAGAHVRVVEGAGHFMASREPEVLQSLLELLEATDRRPPA